MIRVVLAEDQRLVRGALATLINLQPDLSVVAEVGTGNEVLAAAARASADVALLDIQLPGLDGIAAARLLHQALPSCAVVMLTTFGRPGYLQRALRAGARGFLLKEGAPEALASALRRVVAGELVVDAQLADAVQHAGPDPLSSREREVLSATRDGSTAADVARRLHLSEGTVRNYLSAAIQKTSARNRVEALRIATERGWL